ncbi:hypothetical protein KIPB_007644, partial [Kipferlia bialata]|eukprot:g7644.t1
MSGPAGSLPGFSPLVSGSPFVLPPSTPFVNIDHIDIDAGEREGESDESGFGDSAFMSAVESGVYAGDLVSPLSVLARSPNQPALLDNRHRLSTTHLVGVSPPPTMIGASPPPTIVMGQGHTHMQSPPPQRVMGTAPAERERERRVKGPAKRKGALASANPQRRVAEQERRREPRRAPVQETRRAPGRNEIRLQSDLAASLREAKAEIERQRKRAADLARQLKQKGREETVMANRRQTMMMQRPATAGPTTQQKMEQKAQAQKLHMVERRAEQAELALVERRADHAEAALSTANDKLHAAEGRATQLNQDLSRAHSETSGLNARVTSLTKELDKIKTKMGSLRGEEQESKRQVRTLTTDLRRFKKWDGERERVIAQMGAAETAREETAKELEETKATLSTAEAERDEHKAERERLEAETASQTESIASLTSQLETTQQSLSDVTRILEGEREETQAGYEKRDTVIVEQREKIDRLSKVETEAKEGREREAELMEGMAQLQDMITAAEETVRQLKGETSRLNGEAEAACAKGAQLEEERDRLTNE